MKATTKGGIVLSEIKVGDVHYEYSYNSCITTTVITQPINDNGVWHWEAQTKDGSILKYAVTENLTHYGPNLYNYKAYNVKYEL